MQPSIFSKIIKGEIPCHKIYEDERTFAFLDIHPMQPGHVIVVPKIQVDEFQNLTKDDYIAVFNTVKLVAERLKEAFPTKRVGLKVIGIDVPHAHVHVLPFADMDEYGGAVDMGAEPDHDALAEMAQKLVISDGRA